MNVSLSDLEKGSEGVIDEIGLGRSGGERSSLAAVVRQQLPCDMCEFSKFAAIGGERCRNV